MANQWDRIVLFSVPVLQKPATHDKIRNLANKNVILFIIAFTCTDGWDFCWSCFLLSLNLSVLSPDVTLAAELHFFFFLGRLLSRRNVKIPRVKKKKTNYLFQMLCPYKSVLNVSKDTWAFYCGNI